MHRRPCLPRRRSPSPRRR
ncbi:unnamed protein product [Linum tenue]|uniref:Uncharacterized protein n=1 Tax=Linum tenue TaxID=586396 RepID=A0AAV0PNQ7_9ROSI|nr:unnamed protein product [Linum tenue]